MEWDRLLAYIAGTVGQELLLRNEYLAAENRILRAQIKGRPLLLEAEKARLADIGHRLGRKALAEVAATAKPDTILGWFRKLLANKFDGSRYRRPLGRPPVDEVTEALVVQMAKENPTWGYDRIVGALANLGHRLSDQTVGNILRRHQPSAPRPESRSRWQASCAEKLAGTGTGSRRLGIRPPRIPVRPSPPSSLHLANHGVTAPGHIQMTSHDPMNVSPFTFPRLVARAPSPSDTTEQLFAGAMHCC